MRYIDKADAPDVLLRYVVKQKIAGLNPSYTSLRSDLGGKSIKFIEKKLYKEQKGACCYCNKFLDNDFHIEHFLPQSKFKKDEVKYDNLFLSCNSPFTCGKIKGNFLVSKYITYKNCIDLFKYGTNGEILPNCSHTTIKKCFEDWTNLSKTNKDILMFIETLDLNHISLVNKRKDTYRIEYIDELGKLNNDRQLIELRLNELIAEETADIYNTVLIFWFKENLRRNI